MPNVPEAPGVFRGPETVILGPYPERKYRHTDGSPFLPRVIKSLMGDSTPRYYLEPGDDLLWADSEVYGETYYRPRGQDVQRWLGLGRKVLPAHEGLDTNTLIDLGYVFMDPRPDVEPVIPLAQFEQMQKGQPGDNPPLPPALATPVPESEPAPPEPAPEPIPEPEPIPPEPAPEPEASPAPEQSAPDVVPEAEPSAE